MKNSSSQVFDLGKVIQTNLRQSQAKLLLVLQDETGLVGVCISTPVNHLCILVDVELHCPFYNTDFIALIAMKYTGSKDNFWFDHICCAEVALLSVSEDFSLGERELKEASTVQNRRVSSSPKSWKDWTENLQKTLEKYNTLCSGLTLTDCGNNVYAAVLQLITQCA